MENSWINRGRERPWKTLKRNHKMKCVDSNCLSKNLVFVTAQWWCQIHAAEVFVAFVTAVVFDVSSVCSKFEEVSWSGDRGFAGPKPLTSWQLAIYAILQSI